MKVMRISRFPGVVSLIIVNSFLFAQANLSIVGQAVQGPSEPRVLPDQLYLGTTTQLVALADVIQGVEPGTIVIVSELHGFAPHHDKQVQMIEALNARFPQKVSVAMEFLDFTQQDTINQFLFGQIDEATFLKAVKWGQPSFDFYRRQTLYPQKTGGLTIGINAPRSLTGKIANKGIESLTPEEKELLPPFFTLGSDLYRARFKEIMGGHVTPEQLERYFTAQSVWDDTMATTLIQYLRFNPTRIVVVIVGDFHNAYKLGLPNRLVARGAQKLITISQEDITGMDNKEAGEAIAPHSAYGPRADFVWTSVQSKGGGGGQEGPRYLEGLNFQGFFSNLMR